MGFTGKKMLNRFRLVLDELDFAKIDRWLDVGCGTGAFQEMVLTKFPAVKATGLDISEGLLEFASSRPANKDVRFILGDFLDFEEGAYDLISCIGVLQKTTFDISDFFSPTLSDY